MITLQELLEQDKRPLSVTVYMVCYNHEKYLDEAIQGVLKQKTNFPVHIVIHDDASTDSSQDIIRRYADQNPNITAILEETNFYQNGKSFFPIVLPYFIEKYIAYCECDDFWIDENKLQRQIDYLESNPDCIAVYHNMLPVNKYSEYDETKRVYYDTGEGDYPRRKLSITRHQLSSCVTRNFWPFMTPEEIDFYIHTRGIGDQKQLAMYLRMGRVHHFSERMAAHRHVADDGDSYSARMSRLVKEKGKYVGCKSYALWTSELYLMLEHFFGKKYARKYLHVLFEEVYSRWNFHRSVIKDAELNPCYHLKNIPLYIYPLFPFYFVYKWSYKLFTRFAKRFFPTGLLMNLRAFQRKYFG